jgi:hypothetical protein
MRCSLDHEPVYTANVRAKPDWYCTRCDHHVKAADILQGCWGPTTAVICPMCALRLGEIRYGNLIAPTARSHPSA